VHSSEIVCSEKLTRFECGERFVRSWGRKEAAESSSSGRIVLGLIHGLGDHSGRYDEMARWFAARGIQVYAFDLLGHGNSPGEKLVIRNYESLLQDVEFFFDHLKQRHPDSRVGLYGQSMGGNLVLNHQLRGYSRPAFVIAGSPMLRAVNQPGAISMFLMRLLSHVYPNHRLTGEFDPSDLSRDPEKQRAFAEDPLVERGITLHLARVLIDSGEWAIKSASQISTATLLTHGADDQITCHKASLAFAERSLGKATTKIWPEGKHDLHHDIVRDEYFASLFEWIGTISQASKA
jgi:alpha-beta hydrolase superfamily lysophospholipase